ncbi:MAG: DUF3857 domain-containing protein [Planctomycetota bacterium]
MAVAVLLGSMVAVHGQPSRSQFSVAPAPAWVLPAPWGEMSTSRSDSAHGVSELLSDVQLRVANGDTECYARYVTRVDAASGLERASELKLEFEPSHQRLIIHSVSLVRDNIAIDALRADEVRILQQESELDQRLYNGTLSALIVLHDVRVGDVVDYSYSVDGSNPILRGTFCRTLYLARSQPVRRLRRRLLWPSERRLHLQNQGTTLVPVIRTQGGVTEYSWQRDDVPAVDQDDGMPSWYSPFPSVQLSEFETWGEVAAWAVPLYRVQGPLSRELREQVDRWRTDIPDLEHRVLEALRFVQDDVRYLGIELGPYSHQPHQPADVFRQRFGDCKDKSLLLCTLLGELGVEAHPVLVNTAVRRALDSWQPSPFAFDHVIVQARIADATYWFDATQHAQRGSLAVRYPPGCERGLIVAASSTELAAIPLPPNDVAEVVVDERYCPDGAGTRFDVTTTYRRREADHMRASLVDQPLGKMGQDYLDYYGRRDPEIASLGLPRVRDDTEQNVVIIAESYHLPSFWKSGKRYFTGDRVRDELRKPAIYRRSAPLQVRHPTHVWQHIHVELPDQCDVRAQHGSIVSDALRFDYVVACSDDTLEIDYRFRTLRDHVTPDEIKKHVDAIDCIHDATSLCLEQPQVEPRAAPRPPRGSLVFATAAGLMLLISVVRRTRDGWRRWRFERRARQRLPIGASAMTAISVAHEDALQQQLATLRCTCGALVLAEDVARPRETVRFAGRRLIQVAVRCARCDQRRELYFHVSSPGDGQTRA